MPRTVRDPSVNVFLAGTPEDLATIEAMIAVLPICAYGQVVVESDQPLPAIALPRRVQLRRIPVAVDSASGAPLAGESIWRAVDAWLEEWMPGSADPSSTDFYAWVGCESSPLARDAGRRVGDALHAALSR